MNKLIENIELEFLLTANIIILIASVIMYCYIMYRYTSEQRLERKKRDLKNYNRGYSEGIADANAMYVEELNRRFGNDIKTESKNMSNQPQP